MNIKINDKFYRYIDCGGVFEYIVKGVRNYGDDTQYELECQTCNHGPDKCLLLCAVSDYRKLEFVKMLKDEDGEQKHWHNSSGSFLATQNEALVEKGKRMEREIDDEIRKAKERLQYLEKQKADQIRAITEMCGALKNK